MSYLGTLGEDSPTIDPTAWVAPGAVVVGRVTLGRASSVWYGSVLRGDDEEIVVGEECNIQDLSCLHSDPGLPAVLEDRVSLGHKAMVHGAHIETGSLIGIGAIVLNGARVGSGTLIAAGALVPPGKKILRGAGRRDARQDRPGADRRRPGGAGVHPRYVREEGRAAPHRAVALTQGPI